MSRFAWMPHNLNMIIPTTERDRNELMNNELRGCHIEG